MVNTTRGRVKASELGFTLMHEHMAMVDPAMRRAFADWFDEETFAALGVPQLRRARSEGICTMLDPTPISLGRDVRLIARLARESGITLIVSTGLYYFDYPSVNAPDLRRGDQVRD